MTSKQHWQHIYETKSPTEVSWYQSQPRLSLELITTACPDRDAPILDVGGGASTLVDGLLEAGYTNLTVLDLAGAALAQAQARLGPRQSLVRWLEADVLQATLPPAGIALWHDRAVFHFLTGHEDRAAYVRQIERSLRPGGHVVMGTFAADGPLKCSGLEIVRYSHAQLMAELGPAFTLVREDREVHQTPSGSNQAFTYCLARYQPKV